ncbi:hypothetical protein QQZ08_007468 [Neonectria magnoliae]|uniref:Uncharacterized protein n=1 Tax=Neonectria magnoliae TaxID=2732573 RepID=A0ABR1HZ06_9HYPO
MYYLAFFGAAKRIYQSDVSQFMEKDAGLLRRDLTLLRIAKTRVEIRKFDHYDEEHSERVRRFGRRWRTRYILRKDMRHPTEIGRGHQQLEEDFEVEDHVNFLYWFFGGYR